MPFALFWNGQHVQTVTMPGLPVCYTYIAEGHEYSVLATFRAEDQLPDELSMEMHASASAAWPTTTVELGFTFMHLANLGYALYAQEVNPIGEGCCCEVTFMRLPVRQVEHR